MKLIKTFGLVLLTALMTMAFAGASSATAENTALCTVDESPCEAANRVSHVHETTLSGAKMSLLNSVSNVLCDVLFLGDVKSANNLGAPLTVKGNFTYTNCVDEKPNKCTVVEENGPATKSILKYKNESATSSVSYLVKVTCSGISCTLVDSVAFESVEGPLSSLFETNGEAVIFAQGPLKESGLLCPLGNSLDVATTPLSATYVSS